MRYVDPPPRPRGWYTHVFQKGRAWLNEAGARHRDAERPVPHWNDYRDKIGEAFDYLCCYTAMYVANGQADHFVPWARLRNTRRASDAYRWSNIRYADGWINASKGSATFPDPFVVEDDWFELELPSLVLKATDRVPDEHGAAVANLLQRVASDERVMKQRRRYLRQYLEGIRSLACVDEDAPLLGRALRRHPEYLRDVDRSRVERQ